MINYIKNNHLSIVIILYLVISPFLIGGSNLGATESTTITNPWTFQENITLSTATLTLTGASSDLTVGGVISVTGTSTIGVLDASEFTQGGGIATLTDANGGTYTLTSTELLNNNILKFAAGGAGQQVIALTFPASSTLSAIIPNAGDFREWVYDANALAAATTTTITAGTGMNIIAVTTADDVIDGAEFSRISCWRQADTDITCIVSELLHAD